MAEEKLTNEKTIDRIVNAIQSGNNFLLSGGAGSGKTYLLVKTIQKISSIDPSASIACITYTNAAAAEIRNRVGTQNIKVSTIHDFLWESIKQFQKELKKTLLDLINSNCYKELPNPNPEEQCKNDFPDGIQYKQYLRIANGEISHDQVLVLANKMFDDYPRLCDLMCDRFQFIFVDEYQDTSKLVIEILLKFLQRRKKKSIIGFFGDSMQSIYDAGVGDIEEYVKNKQVVKIIENQNRRNPQSVINLANKLRIDGLYQDPSSDKSAPNMQDGVIKQGTAKFLYSCIFDLSKVKKSKIMSGWDFDNANETKELRLTYKLISTEAGFENLLYIYNKDPLIKLINDFKAETKIKKPKFDNEWPFEKCINSLTGWVLNRYPYKGKKYLDVFLSCGQNKKIYDYVKRWPYDKVKEIRLDKENLFYDKKTGSNALAQDSNTDLLIRHLFSIERLVHLYESNDYNELIRSTSLDIKSVSDKKKLKDAIDYISRGSFETIENIMNYANEQGLCVIDDRLKKFINDNDYQYWRVSKIPFSEIKNLYNYNEGYSPFSTQHKTKGLEFKNVLVVLHNGNWKNYDFKGLFTKDIKDSRNDDVLYRTLKLFYVCCTRAKDNLAVYYPSSEKEVIEGAIKLFGKENCINLDSELSDQE